MNTATATPAQPVDVPTARVHPAIATSTHGSGGRDFASATTGACTTPARARTGRITQLMQLLMLLELSGSAAPQWIIDELRCLGLESLADELEARNRRIDRGEQRSRPLVAVDRAAETNHLKHS